jgi:hypothetical protein
MPTGEEVHAALTRADSVLSLIAHRHRGDIPEDIRREADAASGQCRQLCNAFERATEQRHQAAEHGDGAMSAWHAWVRGECAAQGVYVDHLTGLAIDDVVRLAGGYPEAVSVLTDEPRLPGVVLRAGERLTLEAARLAGYPVSGRLLPFPAPRAKDGDEG